MVRLKSILRVIYYWFHFFLFSSFYRSFMIIFIFSLCSFTIYFYNVSKCRFKEYNTSSHVIYTSYTSIFPIFPFHLLCYCCYTFTFHMFHTTHWYYFCFNHLIFIWRCWKLDKCILYSSLFNHWSSFLLGNSHCSLIFNFFCIMNFF